MKNSKIKIFFLDHTPFIGGAQLSLGDHLEKINLNQFEPIVVCSEEAERIGLTEIYNKYKIKYYFISFARLKIINPIVLLRLIKSILQLNKLIKKENPDIIFGNTIRTCIVGSVSAFLNNVKIIWFIQDYTFPRALFYLFYLFPKKIYYVSKSVAEYYRVNLNDKNKILYIWRNFHEKINNIAGGAIDEKRKEILNNHNINNKYFIIGYVGRLIEWKGPQVLIEASSALLKNKLINFKIIIIGSGGGQAESNEEYLKSLVKEKKLNDYVIFTGFQKNIPLYIKCLDILCLTSKEPEPYSSVVIEAMMAKVPVIGTAIGGTPEIIIDNETGLLVKPNKADDLAAAIEKICLDPELREKISEQAYKIVMEHNTSLGKTRELEEAYIKILKK